MKIVSIILLLFTTSLYASEDMPAIFYTSLNKTKTTTTPLLKNPLMPDTLKGKVVFKINGKNCDECFDKDGKLKFHTDEYDSEVPNIPENAQFCFECYNDYAKKFVKMFEKFKKIQAKYQKQKHPSKKLKRLDDFRISKTGVLIHEECFDKGRLKFDMEKAIVDAYVTTFSKLIELEIQELEEFTGEPSAILKSHVPRLVNLLDKNNWKEEADLISVYKRNETSKSKVKRFTDPCRELASWTIKGAVKNNCKYIPLVESGRQKIFCQLDEISKKTKKESPINFENGKAFSSIPSEPFPVVKNVIDKKGRKKTKIYGSPAITFVPENTKDWTSERFQSTFLHETFHNLGYEDHSRSENPYSYLCQAAIFYEKTHMDVMGNVLFQSATDGCLKSNYDFNMSSVAGRVSEAIANDKDGSL